MDVTRNKLRTKTIESFSKGKYGDGAGLYLKKANRYRGKWAFIYSLNGRKREMGLGKYPTVSFADARKSRDAWDAERATGKDPVDLRNEIRANEREAAKIKNPTLFRAGVVQNSRSAGLSVGCVTSRSVEVRQGSNAQFPTNFFLVGEAQITRDDVRVQQICSSPLELLLPDDLLHTRHDRRQIIAGFTPIPPSGLGYIQKNAKPGDCHSPHLVEAVDLSPHYLCFL